MVLAGSARAVARRSAGGLACDSIVMRELSQTAWAAQGRRADDKEIAHNGGHAHSSGTDLGFIVGFDRIVERYLDDRRLL